MPASWPAGTAGPRRPPAPCRASCPAHEGRDLIDQVAAFGRPHPILVLTGGDCLLRPDVFELVAYATRRGVPVAMSPSVTPMLTPAAIDQMVASGVKAVSLSLDGATPATHDGVRGIPGHFDRDHPRDPGPGGGWAEGADQHHRDARQRRGARRRSPRSSPTPGRTSGRCSSSSTSAAGRPPARSPPRSTSEVCHFLFDASHYGFIVRTVEAPFFRRVVAERRDGRPAPTDGFYPGLRSRLRGAARPARPAVHGAHGGHPGRQGDRLRRPRRRGLPGGVPAAGPGLGARYRRSPRSTATTRCCEGSGPWSSGAGAVVCEYADLCGGSRARAFADTGDPSGRGLRLRPPTPLTAEMPHLVASHPSRCHKMWHLGGQAWGWSISSVSASAWSTSRDRALGHQIVGPTS